MYFHRYRDELEVSLNAFYGSVGVSKQGLHQLMNRRNSYQEEMVYLRQIIDQIRKDHPTMSCRAMYYKINPVSIGRDKFEQMCAQMGYRITRFKSGRRTTDSNGVIRFENLLNDKVLTGINQAWSSDITYFEVDGVFYYITFILDCFSRRIVGHNVSSRLLTEQTSLPALKMAIKTRMKMLPEGIIFHSDGGGQYYDKDFLALTEHYKFQNSMCEYAYENGKAERLNGVIKNNYLIHWSIKNLSELTKSVDRAVQLYNLEKPHKSLGYLAPEQFEKSLVNLKTQNNSQTVKAQKNQQFTPR